MLKAMILLSRRDDMSVEQFRTWWLDEHAPLAAQLPGARRAVFNVVDHADEAAAAAADAIDGVSELWFDDRAAFDAAYATELGQRVAADSMAHVRSRVRLFVDERSIVD
ncbi:MAG: EthD family reductase [Ilumatobacteraceae bacterium]|nr:EthD family reductase [Ilumatobacteraceae bacterium]